MANTIGKLVTKFYARIQALKAQETHAAPFTFAKGEFAGRRRLIDR